MKKVLFLIHDLGPGGAEKVLVNLVNNMNTEKFDITVMAMFDGGINQQFLAPHIKYKYCFSKTIRGNSHLMKLLSPKQLHKWLIREEYDIEISYLEGSSARIISGCENLNTKLVSWIHRQAKNSDYYTKGFRNNKESKKCYSCFDCTVCVSQDVKDDFSRAYTSAERVVVLYNTNDSNNIRRKATEKIDEDFFKVDEFKIIGVGRLSTNKGFIRLAAIHKRLIDEGYKIRTYILGNGYLFESIHEYVKENGIDDSFTLLGYDINPYKYVANSDLFVCASYAEGFSTATTEALIVGTPVCTVEVSGMKEMLGNNDEYGVVVDNDDEALYFGIKRFLDNPELLEQYRRKAFERGQEFSTENTVKAVEEMLLSI